MTRLARVAIAVVVLVIIAYGGYRLYRRSLPAIPAVVMHDADVGALVTPPIGVRLRQAVLGSAAMGRMAGPKLIALTFDDGPYPVQTPLLLAALRATHVPGTFFLIGRDAEQYPGLVRAIAAAGNQIDNHTETHPNLMLLSDAAVLNELYEGAFSLTRIVRDPADEATIPHEFRPPHGRFTARTLKVAQLAGYDTILWNDDPGDWRNVSRAVLADHIARFATSPEILLLHSGRPETVAMLPGIIARFRAAGYTFVTVDDLLHRAGPDAINKAARTPLPAEAR